MRTIVAFAWSDPAAVAGLVVVIGVVAGHLITMMKTFASLRRLHQKADDNAIATDSAAASAAVAVEKTVAAAAKLEHIDKSVNGNLSRVQQELATSVANYTALQELVRQLVTVKGGAAAPASVHLEIVPPKEPVKP